MPPKSRRPIDRAYTTFEYCSPDRTQDRVILQCMILTPQIVSQRVGYEI